MFHLDLVNCSVPCAEVVRSSHGVFQNISVISPAFFFSKKFSLHHLETFLKTFPALHKVIQQQQWPDWQHQQMRLNWKVRPCRFNYHHSYLSDCCTALNKKHVELLGSDLKFTESISNIVSVTRSTMTGHSLRWERFQRIAPTGCVDPFYTAGPTLGWMLTEKFLDGRHSM